MKPSICFVTAPLIARSGVYNSTVELVQAARAAGLDWTAVIGTSRRAAGEPADLSGVYEFEAEPAGTRGVLRLSRYLRALPQVRDADLRISMVPQSDMALSLLGRPWVAYLRGLPWPAQGEASPAKRLVWQTLEKLSLARAEEIWATTSILEQDVGGIVDRRVPPGLKPPSTNRDIPAGRTAFVWAARYSIDKNPSLFFDALRGSTATGLMYGSGPLESELRASAPANVKVPGWRPRDEIWTRARAYVGTSSREAFGRSATEAAMLGIPVIISEEFGCADMLYTEPWMRELCVLPVGRPEAWRAAVTALAHDDALHASISAHVADNASRLTIDAAVFNVATAATAAVQSLSRPR